MQTEHWKAKGSEALQAVPEGKDTHGMGGRRVALPSRRLSGFEETDRANRESDGRMNGKGREEGVMA